MSRNVWYSAGRATIAAYTRLMIDLYMSGRERIPAGCKLIIANHPSTSDPLYLPLLFPQPIDMLLIDTAFRVPVLSAYLRWAGQVCVMRGDGQAAFAEARRRLAAGRSVAIFPEGNVSLLDCGTLAPRSGAARLALLAGVPVVPVGIYLPHERIRHIRSAIGRKPLNGHWYLRGPYAMTAGQTMRFDGDVNDAGCVASVSDAMMERITALARESENRLTKRSGTPR